MVTPYKPEALLEDESPFFLDSIDMMTNVAIPKEYSFREALAQNHDTVLGC